MTRFPTSGQLIWRWEKDCQLNLSPDFSDRKCFDQLYVQLPVWKSKSFAVKLPFYTHSEWSILRYHYNSGNNTSTTSHQLEFGHYQVQLVRENGTSSSTDIEQKQPQQQLQQQQQFNPLIDEIYVKIQTNRAKFVKNCSLKVLMSALQKNVRLQRQAAAVRTVVAVLQRGEKGITELLRRLPIIIVEDSLVHPLLPNIVWLMMAHTQGYVLQKSDYMLLLLVTYETCLPEIPYDVRCRTLTAQWTHTPIAFKDFVNQFLLLESSGENKDITTQDYSFLFSFIGRSAFGGMNGDINMLLKTFTVWFIRMNGKPTINNDTNDNDAASLHRYLKIPPAFYDRYSTHLSFSSSLYSSSSSSSVSLSYSNKNSSFHHWKSILAIVNSPFSVERDTTLTSIDHHCSNIINDLIQTYGHEFKFFNSACYSKLGNLIWDYRSGITSRKCSSCLNVCYNHKVLPASDPLLPLWWHQLNQKDGNDVNNNNNNNKNNLSIIDQYCRDFYTKDLYNITSKEQQLAPHSLSRSKKAKLDRNELSQTKLQFQAQKKVKTDNKMDG